MREILFRGKRLQGGDWVEGYFFKSDINKRARESGKATLIFTPDCDTFITVPECNNSFMVVSDTVGQYTGLKDKNGKRIFEGDIVRCGTGRICKVVFFISPGVSGFDLIPIGGFDAPPPYRWSLFSDTEVIGNIHDNPDLLESDTK